MNIHTLYGLISPIFRRKRIRRMHLLVGPVSTLLDVGGYAHCWEFSGTESKPAITLLNLSLPDKSKSRMEGFTCVEGDGCDLPFTDASFELLFSNSVIEHIGTWERQLAFAQEARRVGVKLWVQTPAREFFIEPHLIAPCIHWLPLKWQRLLIRNFTLRGWLDRPDATQVDNFLNEVRLLTHKEMQLLFPDCTILRERFLGLTKSYIAVRLHP